MLDKSRLWRLYKEKNDQWAREQLILAYAHLCRYVVDRIPVRTSAAVSYDDLIGHAIIGLIDALERFDPLRQVKFETYAIHRIRGAVLDCLKTMEWVPRSVQGNEQRIRQAFAEVEAELGRPAEDDEVAREIGISVDELSAILADVARGSMLSLEEFVLGGDPPTALVDHDSPLVAAEEQERKRLLTEAIESLPEKEKLVVSLYYMDGLTLKEIAKVLGVTESRACQIHSKAIIRLHAKLARYEDLLLAAA